MKIIKITIYTLTLIHFMMLTSCDSVKRGITGAKSKSTDEFLIKRKDPLILPPDYKNLPTPEDIVSANKEDISNFEKSLGDSIARNLKQEY